MDRDSIIRELIDAAFGHDPQGAAERKAVFGGDSVTDTSVPADEPTPDAAPESPPAEPEAPANPEAAE